MTTARVADIRVFPVKGMDGVSLDRATVLDGGTLEHDREFALFDRDGDVVNGKRTARIHELATTYDPATREFTVDAPDGTTRTFALADAADRDRAAHWFGDYFDCDLTLDRDTRLGYVDRRDMGPSVVSTATLETVASWFDPLTVESARRRLRANVEIEGVPAFWEDRFVGDDAPTFTAGDVTLEGVTPCGRCVVPGRDPDTGAEIPDFRTRFIEKREATFPDWADPDAFDHYFTTMLIANVPDEDRGKTLRVGDTVTTAN